MRLEIPNLFKFRRLTVDAKFLLQAPALQFIKQMEDNAIDHRQVSHELASWTVGQPVADRQELMKKKHELEKWLTTDASQLADEHFRPYLGFTTAELQQLDLGA